MILNRGGGAFPWSFKQGNEGGHIFQKKRKNFYIYSFKGRKPFWFANKTKRTSVKVTWITSSLVNLDIQIYYRLKNLLDKYIVRHPGISQQIVGIHFIVDRQQIFLVSYDYTNHFLGGIECCPLLLNKEVPRRAAPKEPVHNLLMPCCQFVNGPFWP